MAIESFCIGLVGSDLKTMLCGVRLRKVVQHCVRRRTWVGVSDSRDGTGTCLMTSLLLLLLLRMCRCHVSNMMHTLDVDGAATRRFDVGVNLYNATHTQCR